MTNRAAALGFVTLSCQEGQHDRCTAVAERVSIDGGQAPLCSCPHHGGLAPPEQVTCRHDTGYYWPVAGAGDRLFKCARCGQLWQPVDHSWEAAYGGGDAP